jgi:GntR family transcriptional regulator
MNSPAYMNVYNSIREKIMSEVFLPDGKIPPERELCESYGVSRITMRNAFRLLQDQGLVERMPGKGTFARSSIRQKVPILDMDYMNSLKNNISRRELLSNEDILPPDDVAQILGILRVEQCRFIERRDFCDTEAFSYDKGYLPLGLVSSLTEEMLCRVEFLDLWAAGQGLEISHAQSSTEAVAADKIASGRLGVPVGTPMLLTTDTIFAHDGRALAVFKTVYRSDRCKLVSTYPYKRLGHA